MVTNLFIEENNGRYEQEGMMLEYPPRSEPDPWLQNAVTEMQNRGGRFACPDYAELHMD